MSSNYFEKLRVRVRELDDGIAKLITTWNLQHVLIGRFEECTAETNSYVEAVWKTIKDTQNGMDGILSEINSEHIVPMGQFLQETRKEYEGLKEMCDDLETVLAEYDCRFSKNDTTEKKNTSNNKSGSFSESSPERTESLPVECTPCFSRTPAGNKFSTPAINNLTSISDGSFIANKDYVCTPGERPQEPIYSTHFYNILRK
ncbi:uncharacterized protein LOC143431178 [Xylocopa sonorina]|uniref:uncharacterized protein LOC143431178 n=1 Tax=Xylocopa sonorina TaxID=1818115 RepID=UPI00403AE925